MLKAGTLQIVIVVSLVISIFSSAIVFVGYYHHLNYLSLVNQEKLISNCNSGISYLLSSKDLEDHTIDLFNEGEDSVYISSKYWGIYNLGIVRAFKGNKEISKCFLAGKKFSEKFKSAVYLKDTRNPLIYGSVTIKGNCYLPEFGKKYDMNLRTDFTGAGIEGNIYKSETVMPVLNWSPKQLESILSIYNSKNIIAGFDENETYNSFNNSTKVFYSKSELNINKKLSGNYIVCSDTLVRLSGTSSAEDIIVVAPTVIIGAGFKGSLQVFAKDSIIVESNCVFNYPSSLVLIKVSGTVFNPKIFMNSKTQFNGTILVIDKTEDMFKPVVEVSDILVNGNIYSDGKVIFKGRLFGNVTAAKLGIGKESACDNCLTGAEINSSKLSDNFIAPAGFSESPKMHIVKWLY